MGLLMACGSPAVRYEFYRGEVKHLHTEGNKAYQAGDYVKAAEHYQAILEMVPKYAEAHAALGNVALANGNTDEAMKYYNAAITIKPGMSGSLQNYQAYAVTLPKKDKLHPVSGLIKALKQAESGDNSQLQAFVRGLADKRAWVANQRKYFSQNVKLISDLTGRQYQRGQYKSCTDCLLFAAYWVATTADEQHFGILNEGLSLVRSKEDGAYLAYHLGVALERVGKRREAIDVYLRYPNDPRILARIKPL